MTTKNGFRKIYTDAMIKNTETILTVREMQKIHEGVSQEHLEALNGINNAIERGSNISLAFLIYASSLMQQHLNAIGIHNNFANNLLFLN